VIAAAHPRNIVIPASLVQHRQPRRIPEVALAHALGAGMTRMKVRRGKDGKLRWFGAPPPAAGSLDTRVAGDKEKGGQSPQLFATHTSDHTKNIAE
jgi:hypothetical protein